MTWPPIDSAEARELREAEADEVHARLPSAHDARCRDGWLGDDDQDRPIPCPTCRPHLAPHHCKHCGASRHTCNSNRILGGRHCCRGCTHQP